MRPCVGRRALCKPAPTRDVWCNGGRLDNGGGGGIFGRGHTGGGCSGQHVTLHPCDGWKLIQRSMWASAKGIRLTHTHVTRAMWRVFRGKPLMPEGGGEMLQSCLLADRRPSEAAGPRTHTGFRFIGGERCMFPLGWGVGLLLWSASAWTECSTYGYINISLLFSIYPSTPHSRTHFSAECGAHSAAVSAADARALGIEDYLIQPQLFEKLTII